MSVLGAIAGSLVGGLFGSHSAKKQAERQAALQLKNWKYEQSHAHQLEVQDLQNAGLNPILSATGGQIAGNMTVSGSDTSGLSNLGSVITSAMKADMENKIEHGKLENQKLMIENEQNRTQLQAMKVGAEVKLNEVLGLKSAKEVDLLSEQIEKAKVDTEFARRIGKAQELFYHGKTAEARAMVGQAGAIAFRNLVDAKVGEKKAEILSNELENGVLGSWFGKDATRIKNDPFGYLSDKISGVFHGYTDRVAQGVDKNQEPVGGD